MTIERKKLPEHNYIYVDRDANMMDGGAIAAAMGSGFAAIWNFREENGITALSQPTTLYIEMPSGPQMAFRAAIFVSAEDAAKAAGEVKADKIRAGDAYTSIHVGPYASLNVSHKALWDKMDADGAVKTMPVWEIYIDDPTTVDEDKLRTEIYRAIDA